MKFETIYLFEPADHDTAACRAWGEYYSLDKARSHDLQRIADKYDTTAEKMKEHKECWRHIN